MRHSGWSLAISLGIVWRPQELLKKLRYGLVWILLYASVGDDLICLSIQSYSKATTSMANAFQQHPSQVNDMFLKFFLSF